MDPRVEILPEIAGYHPPLTFRVSFFHSPSLVPKVLTCPQLSVLLHALISMLGAYRDISCQTWVWVTTIAYVARVTAATGEYRLYSDIVITQR
jgi:hypothetical protein